MVPGAQEERAREGRLADGRVVDRDAYAGHVGGDRDVRDARRELLRRSCPPPGGGVRRHGIPAVGEVPAEGQEGAGVVVHRELNLSGVVEDLVRRDELVADAQLDERRGEVPFVEEGERAIEAVGRLALPSPSLLGRRAGGGSLAWQGAAKDCAAATPRSRTKLAGPHARGARRERPAARAASMCAVDDRRAGSCAHACNGVPRVHALSVARMPTRLRLPRRRLRSGRAVGGGDPQEQPARRRTNRRALRRRDAPRGPRDGHQAASEALRWPRTFRPAW